MNKVADIKRNLGRVPIQQKRILQILGIVVALVGWLFFTGGEENVRVSQVNQDSPTHATAKIDKASIIDGTELAKISAVQADKKKLIEEVRAKEALSLNEEDNASAFLGSPDLTVIKKSELDYIPEPVQEIKLLDPFKTAKSLKVLSSEKKYSPLLTSEETKPPTTSPLTVEKPDKLYAQTVVSDTIHQRNLEEMQRLEDKYNAEVAMYFQYLKTVNTKQNLAALNGVWRGGYEAKEGSRTTRQSKSIKNQPIKNVAVKEPVRLNYNPNIDRTKIGQSVLLPGDRILTEVEGNVNSDFNSIVKLNVIQGALRGAEIICEFRVSGAERDQPIVTCNSITWHGHTAPIKGFLTEPTKNNNYITGDTNYHTVSRWFALASSYLIKGYATLATQSGVEETYDPITRQTTRKNPEYTEEGLWIAAGGELANKTASIAGAYFGRPPTVKLNSGDVFGLLITTPIEYDWLPIIKKGRDVL